MSTDGVRMSIIILYSSTWCYYSTLMFISQDFGLHVVVPRVTALNNTILIDGHLVGSDGRTELLPLEDIVAYYG